MSHPRGSRAPLPTKYGVVCRPPQTPEVVEGACGHPNQILDASKAIPQIFFFFKKNYF